MITIKIINLENIEFFELKIDIKKLLDIQKPPYLIAPESIYSRK